MAGEKTKSIGEYGEKIGRNLLDLVGWKDTIRNISITCNQGDEHKNSSGNPKQTHGDDELFIYDCPYFSDRRVAVHVSIKHSEQYNSTESKQVSQLMPSHEYVINISFFIQTKPTSLLIKKNELCEKKSDMTLFYNDH